MRDMFTGRYYKCQGEQMLAIIPAIHRIQNQTTCSIQLITEQPGVERFLSARSAANRRQPAYHRRKPV